MMWQILKIKSLAVINLKNHPHIIRLKGEDEEIADLLKLSPEHLLLRWFNFHLANANHPRKVGNFGSDLKDMENYVVLMSQLDPAFDLDAALKGNACQRGDAVINSCKRLGIDPFVSAEDLEKGNPKVNLIFCATLFNEHPGLVPTEQEKYDAAQMDQDEDAGLSREEKAFRMWINNFAIEDGYVNNLYTDIADGLILLKVLDRVEPGCVDWKKVEMKATNKFKKLNNCNYAVDIGKSDSFGFSLVGIGGVDLLDGNKKLTLAYMWQLVRKHTLGVNRIHLLKLVTRKN